MEEPFPLQAAQRRESVKYANTISGEASITIVRSREWVSPVMMSSSSGGVGPDAVRVAIVQVRRAASNATARCPRDARVRRQGYRVRRAGLGRPETVRRAGIQRVRPRAGLSDAGTPRRRTRRASRRAGRLPRAPGARPAAEFRAAGAMLTP